MDTVETILLIIACFIVGVPFAMWWAYNLFLKHFLPGPDVGETKYDDQKTKKK